MSVAPGHVGVEELLHAGRCVMLDGAVGSELIEVHGTRPEVEEQMWGLNALVEAPEHVRSVHERYVAAGCDVITTDTWALASALRRRAARPWDATRPIHWMDVARDGVRLAREAGAPAVAFSLNGDIESPEGMEMIPLLGRALEEQRPDLILLETLALVRDSTYAVVDSLLELGHPVWLSFRRCRHGVCGVYGEHWGGPEGDEFGRAARRFEQMGVSALLVNCIPPDHVTGMVSWLRDFTDMPLGVYPNLGYLSAHGWRHEHGIDGETYARMALEWRAEGAQIIGGCCGVGPEQIAAAASVLQDVSAGRQRPVPRHEEAGPEVAETRAEEHWVDRRGSSLAPLDFPALRVDAGVEAPTQATLLAWKYLHQEGVGAHQRCLDVGCGTGLLAIELARNNATHVHAIDINHEAVYNTRDNAFRNDVGDRISVAVADLYPWVPDERYDVIVADLPQAPVDPFEQATSHRPVDYWGRSLIDQLIRVMPEALAEDGTLYLLHDSIISQQRTVQELARHDYHARVVDYAFEGNGRLGDLDDQVARVEEQSDAYRLRVGRQDVSVAYLLEITQRAHRGRAT